MKISRVIIENFRGIKKADINLTTHSLLIGPNNVGKSTLLEALDLTLGPDRLNSPDAIGEHDFFGGKYIEGEAENPQPIKIRIECHLTELNERQRQLFQPHLEFWDTETKKILEGELPEEQPKGRYVLNCLRIGFEGYYDVSEDDFSTKSFFLNPPTEEDDYGRHVSKNEKREIGYLYLRFLRTGSRALSLERGSLLDIILQLQEINLSSWQKILQDLKGVGNQFESDPDFIKLLGSIGEKVRKYTPLVNDAEGKSTRFEVTNLTRRDLKRNLHLFVGTEPVNHLVPYKNVGSGTINAFLFALMSLIADLKKKHGKNVIFAMEEPEVALPPYTQRKIVSEILKIADQSLITTHSPYVMENYLDKGILLLKNKSSSDGGFEAVLADFSLFNTKAKNVRRNFRTLLSEGLLSRGIIAVEGVSDRGCIYAVSDKLQEFDNSYEHLDTQGVTVISCEGGGSIESVGNFFKNLQIATYALHDSGQTVNTTSFTKIKDHGFTGLEELIVSEIPEMILQAFIIEAQSYSDFPSEIKVDITKPQETVREILKKRKGYGYESRLISLCSSREDLPKSIVQFIEDIQNDFRNPTTKTNTQA